VIDGPAPQPLAAVLLEWDASSDQLHAVGTRGGEMFDAFFEKYAMKLELETGSGLRTTERRQRRRAAGRELQQAVAQLQGVARRHASGFTLRQVLRRDSPERAAMLSLGGWRGWPRPNRPAALVSTPVHIAVLDDEADITRLLATYLQAQGIAYRSATRAARCCA
jgi:hypothetical protein